MSLIPKPAANATFVIPEMSCNHCKATIEQTLMALDTAAVLAFDMPARRLNVQSHVGTDAMQAALKAAGYDVTAA